MIKLINDKLRITAWLRPGGVTSSKYGMVDGSTWLQKEKQRIEALDEECEIRSKGIGDKEVKALFYSDKSPSARVMEVMKV